jgi:hypothetical protein
MGPTNHDWYGLPEPREQIADPNVLARPLVDKRYRSRYIFHSELVRIECNDVGLTRDKVIEEWSNTMAEL